MASTYDLSPPGVLKLPSCNEELTEGLERLVGRLLGKEVSAVDRLAGMIERHTVGASGAAIVAHDGECVEAKLSHDVDLIARHRALRGVAHLTPVSHTLARTARSASSRPRPVSRHAADILAQTR